MNRYPKMNILYKIGFILLFVCLAIFVAAVIIILLKKFQIGVPLSAAGAVLCLVAIILTMFSKPKAPGARRRRRRRKEENLQNGTDIILTDNSADDIIMEEKGE